MNSVILGKRFKVQFEVRIVDLFDLTYFDLIIDL